MTGRLAAAVLSLALMLACRGTPAPTLPAPPPVPIPATQDRASALRARVDELLADPAVAAGTWGIEVRSLRTQETLVSVNAKRLLSPASTMKTLTLAVAADQLGWTFSYETRAFVTGAVNDGALDGDLVVVGSGDPSLDDWDGTATGVFRSWAARLKDLGIRTINGRIVGDDRVFDDQGYGSGWMWDDLAMSYSAPASGLQFNEGTAQVVVTPGAAVGAPAVLMLAPPYAQVPLHGSIRTERAGAPTSIVLTQAARSVVVGVNGTIALDSGRQVRNIAVPNPTQYFVDALRAGLVAGGIEVRGPAVDVHDLPEAPLVPPGAPAAMTHRSPNLASMADTMMKLSQNLYAETLLRTIALARSGMGSADAGRRAIGDVLTTWGVPSSEVLVADGSGLSRYDLVTADGVVSVLAHVYADERLRGAYIASLPVAGRAGTLAARLKGTAAEGNARAKTGTFTNARAVAGFVRTADDEPLAFDIMANNFGTRTEGVDRVTDAIVASLAAFRR